MHRVTMVAREIEIGESRETTRRRLEFERTFLGGKTEKEFREKYSGRYVEED